MSTPVSMFLLLTLFVYATFSLSFDMSPITISDGDRLNLTGDAYITDEGIQVTTNQTERAGRATYGELLHLWDKTSQNVADFSTHFSFVINSFGSDKFGDGLTFFLAPNGSTIKPSSRASGLGLGYPKSPPDSSSLEAFVAVEFDTYRNQFIDPTYEGGPDVPHVGIDLSNLSSVQTTNWYNNISAGAQNDAWVTYNSSTCILRVDFTGTYNGTFRQGNLSYEVSLRNYLPEYVTIGFSASTGGSFEENNVKSWSFNSTDVGSAEVEPNGGKKKKWVLFAGLGGGGAAILLLILSSTCALRFLSRNKNKHGEGLEEEQLSDYVMDNELENGNGPKKFPYDELVLATRDFTEKLGQGGFGNVYKGFLKATNTFIAVKKITEGSQQGREEYKAEVKIISQLRHMNLVELIGWCHQGAELLLVYEFMPKGSLDLHLFSVNSLLTWEMRYKIAQGLASALLYLHQGLRQYVLHRDIKSSNVMLDNNFNAKLGDFGLARLVDHDKDLHLTKLAGTPGYMAPEYLAEWRASKETDMYSFGIVLLEIGCGRKAFDLSYPQGQIALVEWVWKLYGDGQLLDAADPKLNLSEYQVSKIERLMVVGLWCVHPDSAQRPSIGQAVQLLTSEDRLPDLSQCRRPSNNNATPAAMSGSTTFFGSANSVDSGMYGQASTSSNLTTSSAASTSDFLPNSSTAH
ncbi:L-type lectin-domain containing receptor kinase IX.1-like [Salvia miltiorrhiza]|uniref:L-type lectin-domain containing receptor kinase IX.1-like n=1 Tax=Salvia miltiorrhiza TaxID=226208 RepID=UPI0025ABCCE7|nr:L-type lectin-domain containing receptor kinase IX.1-like [Salvia miltiorrhiza]